jgi:hypothetical protein
MVLKSCLWKQSSSYCPRAIKLKNW